MQILEVTKFECLQIIHEPLPIIDTHSEEEITVMQPLQLRKDTAAQAIQ